MGVRTWQGRERHLVWQGAPIMASRAVTTMARPCEGHPMGPYMGMLGRRRAGAGPCKDAPMALSAVKVMARPCEGHLVGNERKYKKSRCKLDKMSLSRLGFGTGLGRGRLTRRHRIFSAG